MYRAGNKAGGVWINQLYVYSIYGNKKIAEPLPNKKFLIVSGDKINE